MDRGFPRYMSATNISFAFSLLIVFSWFPVNGRRNCFSKRLERALRWPRVFALHPHWSLYCLGLLWLVDNTFFPTGFPALYAGDVYLPCIFIGCRVFLVHCDWSMTLFACVFWESDEEKSFAHQQKNAGFFNQWIILNSCSSFLSSESNIRDFYESFSLRIWLFSLNVIKRP